MLCPSDFFAKGRFDTMKTKKGGFLQQIKDKRVVYLMLLPGLAFLIVTSLYPIFWILRFMFYNYTSFGDFEFIGLQNFVTLAKDEIFWKSFFNTIVYAFFKIILTMPISFALAYFLNTKIKGRTFFRSVFFLPTIISVSIMSMVFYLIFNPYNGSANQILMSLGLIKAPINWYESSRAMGTILVVAVWGAVGNYMIYFLSGLQTISSEVYESADLDGAVGWKRLWHITLPMMAPIIQMVVMLAITQAFKDYETILVMTSGGPNNATNVLYLYIYKLMFPMADAAGSSVQQYGYGACVAFVTAIFVGIITALYLKWSAKMKETY